MERFAIFVLGMLLLIASAGKLEAEGFRFPYREELAGEVAFWKQIFTRYSKNQYVLHDSEYPFIQYNVITLDSTLSPRQRDRILRQAKQEISDLLKRIHARQHTPWLLSEKEKEIYRKFEAIQEPDKFLAASRRVRAQQGIREQFKAGVERSFAYLPHIRKVFRMYGLPEEVGYLPHMESSFNPRAVSHVRAVGMWQFMRATARHFMRVNRIRDERWDPFISTHAAARLLKRNYQALQDWGLAITAYNYGLAGLKRAVRRFGRDYIKVRENYLSRRFGFASRNFYPEFLAVVEIVDSLDVYFPDLQPHEPPRFHEILLPVPVRLPQVIQALNLPLEDIKRLNPAYRRGVWNGRLTVPAGYPLRLPESVDAATVLAYLQLQNPAYAQEFRRRSRTNATRPMPVAYQVLPESRTVALTFWRQQQKQERPLPRVSSAPDVAPPAVTEGQAPRTESLPQALWAYVERTAPLYESTEGSPLLAAAQPVLADLLELLPRRVNVAMPVQAPALSMAEKGQNTIAQWAAFVNQKENRPQPQLAMFRKPGVAPAEPLPVEESRPQAPTGLLAYQHYVAATQQVIAAMVKPAMTTPVKTADLPSGVSFAEVHIPEDLMRPTTGGPNPENSFEASAASATAASEHAPAAHRLITMDQLRQRMHRALSPDEQHRMVVFQGETLEHIARWLGVRVQDIRRWNHLRSSALHIGQRLKLQFSSVSPQEFTERRFQYHWEKLPRAYRTARQFFLRPYIVQNGQTLSHIAARHPEITVNILLYFNEFHKLRRMQEGDIINFIEIIK